MNQWVMWALLLVVDVMVVTLLVAIRPELFPTASPRTEVVTVQPMVLRGVKLPTRVRMRLVPKVLLVVMFLSMRMLRVGEN